MKGAEGRLCASDKHSTLHFRQNGGSVFFFPAFNSLLQYSSRIRRGLRIWEVKLIQYWKLMNTCGRRRLGRARRRMKRGMEWEYVATFLPGGESLPRDGETASDQPGSDGGVPLRSEWAQTHVLGAGRAGTPKPECVHGVLGGTVVVCIYNWESAAAVR